MPGDYSRFTDDPKKRFAKVLTQQGRVTLDSDQNELVDILTRRDRTQALDTFGPAAVPRATTPGAFLITASGADLKIGAGRMYIDGYLAEAFDTDPLTYLTQPFYRAPDPPGIDTLPAGRGLVYLDVWEQELTYVEDPDLLEPALGGVDTTTRIQTVWQVKIASAKDFPDIDCRVDFNKLFPPSPARLTVSVDLPPEPPDPCLPVTSGGFRDVENRHYRVEIHGNSVPRKFKYARDPVESEVEEIKPGAGETVIKVKRIGRDSVLRFKDGNCVELLNDARVLRNEPGIIARITNINEARREITVDQVIAASERGDASGNDANGRPMHARLIRWDQGGKSATDPLNDVIAGKMNLEFGIQIEIKGTPRHGDYWMFPARAATSSAGPLVDAPPRGVIHHYAALAMISGLGTKKPVVDTDCRILWPPLAGGGEDCECGACVNAEDHNSGKYTIDMAINDVKAKFGGKVCLKPGLYVIKEPILIRDAQFLHLTGHGWAVLYYAGEGTDPAIRVESSADITLEGLVVLRFTTGRPPSAIMIRNCVVNIVVQDCVVLMPQPSQIFNDVKAAPAPFSGIAILLDGLTQDVHIRNNLLQCGIGVSGSQKDGPSVAILGGSIDENIILCSAIGVRLNVFALAVNIARNWIMTATTGMSLSGLTVPGTSIEIDENRVYTGELGIVFGTDRTTFSNNTIAGPLDTTEVSRIPGVNVTGILAYTGNREDFVDECRIVGNRIRQMQGYGIAFDAIARRGMVKQNFISRTGGAAIALLDNAAGSTVVIENNIINDVAINDDDDLRVNAAIRVGPLADAAVLSNTIETAGGDLARTKLPSAGVFADGSKNVRIHQNRIEGVAPSFAPYSAAIDVALPAHGAEIEGNAVRTDGASDQQKAHCFNVRIGPAARRRFTVVRLQRTAAATRAARATDKATAAGGSVQPLSFTFQLAQVLLLDFKIFVVEHEPVRAIIRGNRLDSFGPYFEALSMVNVENFGGNEVACTFGGNICVAKYVGPDNRIGLAARFYSTTLVADSNQFLGSMAEAVDVGTMGWTIVGNIVQDGKAILVIDPGTGAKRNLFTYIPPDPFGYYAMVNRQI